MGIIDRLADEYVDFSSERTSRRELLELVVGSVLFVLLASGLAWYLLGRAVAYAVAVVLVVLLGITIVSQTYWAVTGREDYEE